MNRQRTIQKTQQLLIASALFITSLLASCPAQTALLIDSSYNKVCKPCPDNCSICYMGTDKNPICAFCEDGFYMKSNRDCKRCYDNCASCVGPDIEQCRQAKRGFFYDERAKDIIKCISTGCLACSSSNKCIACSEGFFPEDTPKGIGISEGLVCKACEIENCLFCEKKEDQIKNSQYLSCNLCKKGFAIVSGKCEACPSNCLYCQDASKECTFCEAGFWLDKTSNRCEKMNISNCYALSDTNECLYCETHFYLKNKECVACKKEVSDCSHCAVKEDKFICLSCEIGFFLDSNECKQCPANCNHCNKDRCFICNSDKFYNAETDTCEICSIDKCDVCKITTVCDSCISGFYMDSKSNSCQKFFY